MKLLRFGNPGLERPGALDNDGNIRDLTGCVPDISGAVLNAESLAELSSIDMSRLPVVDHSVRSGPCVGSVGKFICIGLNYSDHAAESGMAVLTEAVVFMKATSSTCGPTDNIELPIKSTKSDWEVELGVIIGTKAKYVSKATRVIACSQLLPCE
ncbi:MAG TPA: fumarylacetoacetate hydrolase family protein [Acidobacteriaceae bacterium]|jgi:2-keto-4-pentenoate hydratase/2-oxohepta-3-ene-1,7-dioic acid hydratase in catechol pathway|nr:fumarylacetoacetate hydrolase family protein [Acidobacteriaceae bacterium]